MSRRYESAVEECGTECPAFVEDGYETAVHSCEFHFKEMPAEMFQRMLKDGECFPDFCPLSEIED